MRPQLDIPYAISSGLARRPALRHAVALLAIALAPALAGAAEVIPLAAWERPPHEARPIARWWWPGGSVEDDKMEAQLRAIAAAGFGGVELQPLLLGIGDDELAADPRLRTVGEPAFRESVARAATAAAGVGLDFDLTVGSGWPGGLPTASRNAERQLLMATVDVSGPAHFEGALPPPPEQSYRRAVEWLLDVLGPPDPEARVVAALAGRIGPEREGVPTLLEVRDLTGSIAAGRLSWEAPQGHWQLFVFYANSTSHFVMGGAFPGSEADALVVDHLSERGADALLDGYVKPVVGALEPGTLRGLFIDSFELMGELPFTDGFREAFRAAVGYDLTPHLPLLFRKGGESKYGEMIDLFGRSGGPRYVALEPGKAERIREDYEAVRSLLFQRRFVGRFASWAKARGLELRLQAHGGYGDTLDTYALADVPESEGLFGNGSFDFLKLAASAAHVADRPWASSESFITLRFMGTRLSDEEMWLLAGRAFSAGINRLVFHGVPYPYTRVDGEAWYPFIGGFGRILAGPLPMSSHIDAGFLASLPDFNLALSRLSVAMSEGAPAADIAWLRADPSYPDTASFQLGRVDAHAGESPTTVVLRARGLVHDRVSRLMLEEARVVEGRVAIGARTYAALLLDPLEIAEPALAARLAEIAEAGVPVLALGALPERAPGWRDAEARDRAVRVASQSLATQVLRAADEAALETLLARHVRGGLVEPVVGEALTVSLERRRSDAGDTLLVVNESWSSARVRLRFTRAGGRLIRWDPRTGSRTELRERVTLGDVVEIELAATDSIVLTLATAAASE